MIVGQVIKLLKYLLGLELLNLQGCILAQLKTFLLQLFLKNIFRLSNFKDLFA